MKCPLCKGGTVVISSRVVDKLVRRHRKCKVCGNGLVTREVYADEYKGVKEIY